MDTDKIDSDDMNFYSRKRNFDVLSRKLNKYYDTKFDLFRGNDLRYNNYIRKLTKLAKFESLDEKGYQDYLKGVQELQESKTKSSRNLAKYLLDELINKQNKEQELKDFITQVINKGDSKINIDSYMKWSEKDTKVIVDSLVYNFETQTRKIFKIPEYNHLTDQEFQDIKILRIAKFAIKLRYGLLNNEFRHTSKEKEVEYKDVPSIHDLLLNAKPDNLPLFDREVYNVDKTVEAYDDLLFHNINKYLLSTDTFERYNKYLFDESFYGEASGLENLKDPNIYTLNSDVIDNLMLELIEKLRKSYDLNEIYNDQEDLDTFKKAESQRSIRRNEMNIRINELKEKYGNIDLLYDDYKGVDEDKKKEIRQFKSDYKEEIESELDPKFKAVFELVDDDRNIKPRKYEKQVDPEEQKQYDEKVLAIRKKIMDEINLKKQGKWVEKKQKVKEEAKYELVTEGENISVKVNEKAVTEKTQDDILEQKIRGELERKYLGINNTEEDQYAPYYDHKKVTLSPGPEVKMPDKKWPKQKLEREEEIRDLNNKKEKFNSYILYSWEKTRTIPMERKRLMKQRFLDYFGRYNRNIYADGYRHLENLDRYQLVYPDRSLAEYTNDCKKYHLNI
jgi:hypothetical protein